MPMIIIVLPEDNEMEISALYFTSYAITVYLMP